MTLRRYAPIAPSKGTVIPPGLRLEVMERDGYHCVALILELEHDCNAFYGLELDHVRASGGIGLKSRTAADNLVSLCSNAHRAKTDNGRVWRPLLLAYLERFA